MNRFIVCAIALLLTSCADNLVSVRLTRPELIGTYFYGDNIGPGEELVLHNDGTYDSTMGGDLIVKSIHSSGTWTLDGDRITFHDTRLTYNGKPFHTFALTQTYKKQIVPVPADEADKKDVSLSFIYRKQPDQ